MTRVGIQAIVPDVADAARRERHRRRERRQSQRACGWLGEPSAQGSREIGLRHDSRDDREVRDARAYRPGEPVRRERTVDTRRAPSLLRDHYMRNAHPLFAEGRWPSVGCLRRAMQRNVSSKSSASW